MDVVEGMLALVPTAARRLLAVGPGLGRLVGALQAASQGRLVWHLGDADAVVEQASGEFRPGNLDVLLFGEGLGEARSPLDVLRRYRRWLGPQGVAVACVPNAQQYSRLAALLAGDVPPVAGHSPGLTASGWLKLFLDAGFAPTLAATVANPAPAAFHDALQPILQHLHLHPGRSRHYFDASHFLFRAHPLPEAGGPPLTAPEMPLSFVACVSDEAVLRAHLLQSPCLLPGTPHELILVRGCRSAADGLNAGLARARHAIVVGLHQDVYLPQGWDQRLVQRYHHAAQRHAPLGVAGVYGVSCLAGGPVRRAGHVVDRDRLLAEPVPLPAVVDTLDELLLAVPRETPLRFDPQLGFHFYGADLCLQAARRGLKVVALDALCLHASRSVELPPAFYPSAERFLAKWRHRLPVATSCVRFDSQGRMRLA